MKDLKRRNIKSMKTSYRDCIDREMFFDEENNDIIINREGAEKMSLYKEVLNRGLEKEVITKTPTVYGFVIDDSEVDPNDRVTYLIDNVNYVPISIINNKIDMGSWSDKISSILGITPCIVKDGIVIEELTFSDYMNTELGVGEDLMIRFKKCYYSITNINNKITVKISNYNPGGSDFDCNAFKYNNIEKDYMYIGVYEGSVIDDKLRSIPEVTPTTNIDISKFKEYATNKGKQYGIMDIYRWQYVNLLLILLFKTTAPNFIIGDGNKADILNTRSENINNVFCKNKDNSNIILGLENFIGNTEMYIDGISVKDEEYYITNNDISLGKVKPGYISSMSTEEGILYPTDYIGNSCGYYASIVTLENTITDNSLIVTDNVNNSGIFSTLITENSDYVSDRLGSRLIYLS